VQREKLIESKKATRVLEMLRKGAGAAIVLVASTLPTEACTDGDLAAELLEKGSGRLRLGLPLRLPTGSPRHRS